MSGRSLGAIALVACLIGYTLAQDAQCNSGDFEWARNAEGKDPCQLANALAAKCNSPPFTMLSPGTAMYGGPGENNDCVCNFVEYNLLRVCARCQNAADAWVENFPDWAKNCAKKDVATFAPGAPDGVSIPAWASAGALTGPWSLDALKGAAGTPPAEKPKPDSNADQPPQEEGEQKEPGGWELKPNPKDAPVALKPMLSGHPKKLEPAPPAAQQEEPTTTSSTPPSTPSPTPTNNAENDNEKPAEGEAPAVQSQAADEPSSDRPGADQDHSPDNDTNGTPDEQENPSPGASEVPKAQHTGSERPIKESRPKEEQGDEEAIPSDFPKRPPGQQVQAPAKGADEAHNERVEEEEQQEEQEQQGEEEEEEEPIIPTFAPKIKNPTSSAEPTAEATEEPAGTDDEAMFLAEPAPSTTTPDEAVPKLAEPTDLPDLPPEPSAGEADELLVASPDEVVSNDPEAVQEDNGIQGSGNAESPDEPELQDGPFNDSVDDEGDAGNSDADVSDQGRYQYNGDPGVAYAETEGKNQKAKIAAICVTIVALIVLAAVAYKLYTCFLRRRHIDDDRESWLEQGTPAHDKEASVHVSAHKGILGRQSVWDRIQRSLMPKSARSSEMGGTVSYLSSDSRRQQPDAVYAGHSDHFGTQPMQLEPQNVPPQRRSFWTSVRESLGPFGRRSFVAPTPTPNLAALRGIQMPKSLRPGILKKQQAGTQFETTAQDQEVLEDDEAIRPRWQGQAATAVDSIPYHGQAQNEERRWI